MAELKSNPTESVKTSIDLSAPIVIEGVKLSNRGFLAPMSGVSDAPFRRLAWRFGAGLVVSEMVASEALVTGNTEMELKALPAGLPLHVVQIAGRQAQWMALAARMAADNGASIIDINMGCPAKKICNVMAGSALLQDEALVGRILDAVVGAVDVPVTLKIRTGWDTSMRNGVAVAKIAEAAGIQALSVHGRTRACGYKGDAEYDTIQAIKQAITIPIIANGDITTPEKAKYVLEYTGADGIMIGRAAQGRPWIFKEINHYLKTGEKLAEPGVTEVRDIMLNHLHNLYAFYGEYMGVRIARKHISWYSKGQRHGAAFRQVINRVETQEEQLSKTKDFFDHLIMIEEGLAA